MKRPSGEAVFRLPSETGTRFVGVDFGYNEFTTECEGEIDADGVLRVLDIREIPRKGVSE